jgi:branched-chain amino acid transport system substrate-binding protein
MIPRDGPEFIWCALLAAALAATAPGCGRSRPIRIGVAIDPTACDGAVLAAEDLNRAGGVDGRHVELVFDTVSYDPSTEATVLRAERLADAGVSIVLSDNASQQSLALGDVLNERGIVHLNANSTSPRIHDLGAWSYTLAPDDLHNGRYLAARIHAEVPGARVAVLYLNAAYGEGLRRGMHGAFREQHDSVVWELPFVDTVAIPDLLALARHDGASVVVLAAYAQGLMAALAALAKTASAERPRLYAGDAAVSTGPGTDGVRVIAFWSPDQPDSASRGFVARFAARFGAPARPVDALNYDAVRLAAEAVAGSSGSSESVRRYLESLGRGRAPLAGLSGPISFDARRRVGARVRIAEYRDRTLHLLPARGPGSVR